MFRHLRIAFALVIAVAVSGCQDQPPPTAADATPIPSNPSTEESASKPDALSSAPQADSVPEIELGDPTLQNPVVAGAVISPATSAAGSMGTLTVRAKIADNWHIYAAGMPAGVGIPTKLDLRLPETVTPDGDWITPATEPYATGGDACFVYYRDIVFQRKLRIADGASPGEIEIGCDFNYQACNDAMCLPPKKLALNARWEITTK